MNEVIHESIKVILLGETYVGKTCLINVYYKNKFEDKMDPTLSPLCLRKSIEINGLKFYIQIWDTAGEEKFRCINKIFIKDSQIVIFVYDITRKSTFAELPFWVDYVEKFIGKETAIYGIIGNKIDLFDKEEETKPLNPKEEFDLVNKQEAEKFANEIGALFCETSAKDNAPGFSEFINKLVENYIREKSIDNLQKEVVHLKSSKKEKKKCCSS